MKNAVKIAFAVAVATVGIAACTSAPVASRNTASGTPEALATPPSSSSTVVTEITTVTVTNPPAPDAFVNVDTRPGYGKLKLGMTSDEAIAAGLKGVTWAPGATCTSAENVVLSKKYGIERITLPTGSTTSRGIGVGATVTDVKKAYPDAKPYSGGYSVSLDENGIYSFSVTSKLNGPFQDSDKVEAIKLIAKKLDCANAAL